MPRPLIKTFMIMGGTCSMMVSLSQASDVFPWQKPVIDHSIELPKLGALTASETQALVDYGEQLFVGQFSKKDGVGRPMATQAIIPTKTRRPNQKPFLRSAGMDANSCAACHNAPIIGGAGDFVTNVFVSEGFNNASFDSLDPQFSNERGSNHLFGAGLVELLAREMSASLQATRTQALKDARAEGEDVTLPLEAKGVDFGAITASPDGLIDLTAVDGVDDDLVVRPFSQKGVMTSLRQFSVNALNHHHGIQATERFGARWTGEQDFDQDGKLNEANETDVAALVAWQALLKTPVVLQPDDQAWSDLAQAGETKFADIGCASCHMPSLPLEATAFSDPGPYDAAGTVRTADVEQQWSHDLMQLDWFKALPVDDQGRKLIPLLGDLKRHVIADEEVDTFGNELLAQRFVERNVFMTSELWGIASTAPYGHRNDLTSMEEAIEGHGGAARKSRDAFIALSDDDKTGILAYLNTLVIEQ